MASTVPAAPEGTPPTTVQHRVVCAWCKDEIQAGPASEPTAHGICESCSAKARSGASPISAILFFTGALGYPPEPVRVEAFRRDNGVVGIKHVYTHHGDTWAVMNEIDQACLLDQARTAFEVDDAEEAAVADAQRVGRL